MQWSGQRLPSLRPGCLHACHMRLLVEGDKAKVGPSAASLLQVVTAMEHRCAKRSDPDHNRLPPWPITGCGRARSASPVCLGGQRKRCAGPAAGPACTHAGTAGVASYTPQRWHRAACSAGTSGLGEAFVVSLCYEACDVCCASRKQRSVCLLVSSPHAYRGSAAPDTTGFSCPGLQVAAIAVRVTRQQA